MCTITWKDDEVGYSVYCSRDERKTRQRAFPPRVHDGQGVTYIAPVDRDGGGTWISVNEAGVTLALLNFYPQACPAVPSDRRSRGLLLTDLAGVTRWAELTWRLSREPLSRYEPFRLAVFIPNASPMLCTWNGHEHVTASLSEDDLPLTTSSFEDKAVAWYRRETFARYKAYSGQTDDSMLVAFHQSREPAKPAFSVCMERPDASTVSFTRVEVVALDIRMTYQEVDAKKPIFGKESVVELARATRV